MGIMTDNCHVDDARNSLVRRFMNTDCTDLLFLDSDLSWDPDDVIKILAHTDQLVCGAYPKKCTPEQYPVGRILEARPNGDLVVSYAPTGFMRIRREVFEKLLPTQASHGLKEKTHIFFERKLNPPTYDGGDVNFCRKWIEAGGQVVVDPKFCFQHIGDNHWIGVFVNYLAEPNGLAAHTTGSSDPVRTPIPDSVPDVVACGKSGFVPVHELSGDVDCLVARVKPILTDIINGRDDQDIWQELMVAYGNVPFLAHWTFYQQIWRAVRELPDVARILECGSGLSTLILAASGKEVVSLEEIPGFAEITNSLVEGCGLNAKVFVVPVDDDAGWYKTDGIALEIGRYVAVNMLVIDGPRRMNRRDRFYPLTHGRVTVDNNTVIIIDDAPSCDLLENSQTGGTPAHPFCFGTGRGLLVEG
ncbi:MAG: hypothetical protein H7829_17100 [Magnetococcus sp. THC-1_WYH]